MKAFRINLRPGERIYVNGAVLRADRKVALEFLNEVSFLLESHVILAEETTSPLRQLYFVLQTMLMEPGQATTAREVFETSIVDLLLSFENPHIRAGLESVRDLVTAGRVYEALKMIRALFPIEESILRKHAPSDRRKLEAAPCK